MRPSDVTSELENIWETLQNSNKMRASLFNLIIYTQKNRRADYLQGLAQKAIERFPARVLFVSIDPAAAKDSVKANVSIMTSAKEQSDIVCDYIEFEASSASAEQIPFLILPHLIADLPIYLVWGDDPAQSSPIAHSLQTLATRIIFDSETTVDLSQFATLVLQQKDKVGCDIADLNWARTQNWRELLAATFYSPERLSQLNQAQTIALSYNATESPFFCHNRIQAIYLQGWLASRMGWQLLNTTSDRFEYEQCQVILNAVQNDVAPPGAVIELEITTASKEHFSFVLTPGTSNQVKMMLSTPNLCTVPSQYLFSKVQSNLSLVNEIYHTGTSKHYLKMLEQIKRNCCQL